MLAGWILHQGMGDEAAVATVGVSPIYVGVGGAASAGSQVRLTGWYITAVGRGTGSSDIHHPERRQALPVVCGVHRSAGRA